jgi:hypothetical protein
MAYSKLKTLAKGLTLQFLVKDLQSDRKHIRVILRKDNNDTCVIGCEEHISNKLRNKEMTIKQLIECRYNPKTNMIQ